MPDITDTISHTVASGSAIVGLSNKEKMIEPSPQNAYFFQCTGASAITIITFDLSSIVTTAGDDTNTLIIMGLTHDAENIEIRLKSGSSTVQTFTNHDEIRFRTLNGQRVVDQIYNIDDYIGFDSVEIEINLATANWSGDRIYQIGCVMLSQSMTFPIHYSTLKINGQTVGNKKRDHGGRIHSSKNTYYMTYQFTTTPLIELGATAYTDTEDLINLNYEYSVSEPFVFLPYEGSYLMAYVYQVKPCSQSIVKTPPEDGRLFWRTSFYLEEGL